MKKIGMSVIGLALFVAGYHQIRRQAAYVSNQPVAVEPSYATTSTASGTVPTVGMRQTLAFRLIKSS